MFHHLHTFLCILVKSTTRIQRSALHTNHLRLASPGMMGYRNHIISGYNDSMIVWCHCMYLQELDFTLNILPSMAPSYPDEGVEIILYLYTDDHVVIPRYSSGVYGSQRKFLWVKMERNTSTIHKFFVRKDTAIYTNRHLWTIDLISGSGGMIILFYNVWMVE